MAAVGLTWSLSNCMSRTLEQLENHVWLEPKDSTSLIDTCHRLRRIPIDLLSAGDLRLLLGQRIGVRFLIPRAIELLGEDPLLEATYFPGDLLTAVLRAGEKQFRGFPGIREQLVSIASRAKLLLSSSSDETCLHHELLLLLVEYES